ncbi:hypothetical protein ACVMIX_006543 [Rhizobium leguminosarum]
MGRPYSAGIAFGIADFDPMWWKCDKDTSNVDRRNEHRKTAIRNIKLPRVISRNVGLGLPRLDTSTQDVPTI